MTVGDGYVWQSATFELPAYHPVWSPTADGLVIFHFYLHHLIGFALSIILMVVLIRYPEWYVVNTTGILVGAGVITILGVSFVPWLIIIFMLMAAVYDAWAVYRSKHMLDLADTMIGLKLPILLVAPQDKEYSFLSEGDDTMRKKERTSDGAVRLVQSEAAPPLASDSDAAMISTDSDSTATENSAAHHSTQSDTTSASASDKSEVSVAPTTATIPVPPAPRPIPKEGQGGEALFMGLGDVIFPGMLVVSALTWIPDSGAGLLGISGPMLVALGTLLGGLLGYLVLMTYVAMGRPQAGLPLLNGGAILGYLVSGAIFVGFAAFDFAITIF
jgi:presenilin-like A22 family membrane protease